jgi:hypothetical protein
MKVWSAGLALLMTMVMGCAAQGGDDGGDDGDDTGDDSSGDDSSGDDSSGDDTGPSCGDGTCQATESATTCPGDCDTCGDGTCQATESATTCPGDCDTCGDNICQAGETATCASDCTASLRLQNNSSYYIDEFYIAPCDGKWSVDLLDGYINPGSYATLEDIPPGCYYFDAEAGSTYWLSDATILDPGEDYVWTLVN